MTRSTSKNLVEAARYLRAAADKHNIHSMFNYTLCLYHDLGFPQDQSEAARLFRAVADRQYLFGEVNLGFRLHEHPVLTVIISAQ
jgi:TPR repeat protein